MHQQHHDQDPFQDASTALSVLLFVAEVYTISLCVLLRTRMGSRALGFHAVFVLFLIPVHSMFWKGHDIRPLLDYLWIYLFGVLAQRLGHLIRWQQGTLHNDHSRYDGEPLLLKLCPRLHELTVKQFIEPLFMGAIAAIVWRWNAPLGSYLAIGAGCIALTHAFAMHLRREQEITQRDQIIDMQIQAHRLRQRR